MKKLIALIALITIGLSVNAQVRGTYGTIATWHPAPMAIYSYDTTVYTVVPAGKLDTLTNTDTGAVRYTFMNNLDVVFDFAVTKISGTLAGTALLQGSIDNATWYTITGNTTYCASCIGASATVTNTTGTKHYQWYVPHSATVYPYYQVQVVTTGTCSASYTGSVGYKY